MKLARRGLFGALVAAPALTLAGTRDTKMAQTKTEPKQKEIFAVEFPLGAPPLNAETVERIRGQVQEKVGPDALVLVLQDGATIRRV